MSQLKCQYARILKTPGNDHRRVVCQHEREGGTRGDLYHCRFLSARLEESDAAECIEFLLPRFPHNCCHFFPSQLYQSLGFSTTPAPIRAQNYRPRFYNGTLDTYGQALAEVLVHSVGWWVGQQKTVEVEIFHAEDWSQLPPSFLGVGCESFWHCIQVVFFFLEGGEFEIPVSVSLPEGTGGAFIHILNIFLTAYMRFMLEVKG